MVVGANIKSLRKHLGKNQEELAAILGLSQSRICRLETEKQQPSDAILLKFRKIAEEKSFPGTGGEKINPAWLHPDILLLPTEEFKTIIGLTAEHATASSARANGAHHASASAPAHAAQAATHDHEKDSSANGRAAPAADPTKRTAATVMHTLQISQASALEGYFMGVRRSATALQPSFYAAEFRPSGTGGIHCSLIELGMNPTHDRKWRGVVHQAQRAFLCVIETERTPRDIMTITFLAPGGRPYQSLAGAYQAPPCRPASVATGSAVDNGAIGLFRRPETSLAQLMAAIRAMTEEQSREYMEEFDGMFPGPNA